MLKLARINVVALLILSLLFAPVISQSNVSTARAQDRCEGELKQAEERYTTGYFAEAIELLQRCLDKNNLKPAEITKAVKLMVLSYLATDYLDQARSSLRKLLDIAPTYEPDPAQDPPQFTNLVREMKEAVARERKEQEREKEEIVAKEPVVQMPPMKKGSSKTWLFIGGGVAVGLVAVLVAGGGNGGGGGNDGPQALPPPPDPPR